MVKGVDAAVAEGLCGSTGRPESVLPAASQLTPLTAEKTGFVSAIHAMSIGLTSCRLGSGKEKQDDKIGLRLIASNKQKSIDCDTRFFYK
jgi:thymidine phosphorylase